MITKSLLLLCLLLPCVPAPSHRRLPKREHPPERLTDNDIVDFHALDLEEPGEQAKLWAGKSIRFMQLNTWNTGENVNDGLAKIAKHIKINDPDIVTLQEVRSTEGLATILKTLGSEWSSVIGGSMAIASKHKFNESTLTKLYAGTGVEISFEDGRIAHVFGMHLDYNSYGPYAANNKLAVHKEQIDAGEYCAWCRYENIVELLKNANFQKWFNQWQNVPLFVGGDFNSPSHLDWIEATKHLHGNWVYPWPAPYTLQSRTGMVDSFRELHPDPLKTPGITWSTVNKWASWEWNYTIPEPTDRIDYIFYKSGILTTKESRVYVGNFVPYPGDYKNNDWPSDHYSLVSVFESRQ